MRTTHLTRLIGLLCHPAGENLIHQMFSAACAISGVDAAPIVFDASIREIGSPVGALKTLGAAGVYLDGRLRHAATGVVDYLSDEAHGAGVINTILFVDDHATGHNTEATAIIRTLEPHREKFANGSAVVLGAGALARSAVYALVRHFRVRHLAIADRTPQQAQLLKQMYDGTKTTTVIESHELFPPDIAQLLAEARLIVNATAVGAFPDTEATPLTILDLLNDRQIVLDAIYSPAHTKLLSQAAAAGAIPISGIEILLEQVAESFRILTDSEFPRREIRELLVTNA